MSTATPNPAPRRPRRMTRPPQPEALTEAPPTPDPAPAARKAGKLALVEALLRRPDGASIAELVDATGWQQHSIRGAMAGALKKHGLVITSDKIEGVRRYFATTAQ